MSDSSEKPKNERGGGLDSLMGNNKFGSGPTNAHKSGSATLVNDIYRTLGAAIPLHNR